MMNQTACVRTTRLLPPYTSRDTMLINATLQKDKPRQSLVSLLAFPLTNNHHSSAQAPLPARPGDREQDAAAVWHTLQPTHCRSRIRPGEEPRVAIVQSPPSSASLTSSKPIPSDHSLRKDIHKFAAETAASRPGWLFIETAGGVHSPGPSGTSQADLYAPMRTPVILIGDSKLGGISQTISAFESLKMRGYDVESIIMFKGDYGNHDYIHEYFHKNTEGLPIETVSEPPPSDSDASADLGRMQAYYEAESSAPNIRQLIQTLDTRSQTRIKRLESMSTQANKIIWYPFTQHRQLTADSICAIDSANGDFFQTFDTGKAMPSRPESPVLQPSFDGSASWWTQGLGHANPQLTLAASYAAGRYGHVMFASAVHEPSLKLAEILLEGLGNPRLSRVFYTDNGSTGCEVAIKMALRAARTRYGWKPSDKLDILGLKGSYHGDTMGCMDSSEPSIYNEQVEWYDGKGFWLDYPTVRCYNGEWQVNTPGHLGAELGPGSRFTDLDGVLSFGDDGRKAELERYKTYIYGVIERETANGRKFGGLILEPVILGAGGMIFV